jgi:hypothetical protein
VTFEGRQRLEAEARYFSDFLADTHGSADVEPLIDRYLDFRALCADALRRITDDYLQREVWALDAVLERLENEMRAQIAGAIPLDVVVLPRYGRTHRKLFEYLWLHRGRGVAASRLRVLTGDQVHTERRVRELRDVGLRIEAVRRSGENVYELTSEVPDVPAALQRFAPLFAAEVKGWSPARQAEALRAIGLGLGGA